MKNNKNFRVGITNADLCYKAKTSPEWEQDAECKAPSEGLDHDHLQETHTK